MNCTAAVDHNTWGKYFSLLTGEDTKGSKINFTSENFLHICNITYPVMSMIAHHSHSPAHNERKIVPGKDTEGRDIGDYLRLLPTIIMLHPHCVLVAQGCLTLTPWTGALQAPLCKELPRREYRSGLHSLLQGIFLI